MIVFFTVSGLAVKDSKMVLLRIIIDDKNCQVVTLRVSQKGDDLNLTDVDMSLTFLRSVCKR